MPMRIVVYGTTSDATAYAAMAQIRSLIREMGVDAGVQIVTDEKQREMQGIESTPAVAIEGMTVSAGWVPSRTELRRAIQQHIEMASGKSSLSLDD